MRSAGQLFAVTLWLAACSTPRFETLEPTSDASAGSGGVAATGGGGGTAGNGGSAGNGGVAGVSWKRGLGAAAALD